MRAESFVSLELVVVMTDADTDTCCPTVGVAIVIESDITLMSFNACICMLISACKVTYLGEASSTVSKAETVIVLLELNTVEF